MPTLRKMYGSARKTCCSAQFKVMSDAVSRRQPSDLYTHPKACEICGNEPRGSRLELSLSSVWWTRSNPSEQRGVRSPAMDTVWKRKQKHRAIASSTLCSSVPKLHKSFVPAWCKQHRRDECPAASRCRRGAKAAPGRRAPGRKLAPPGECPKQPRGNVGSAQIRAHDDRA